MDAFTASYLANVAGTLTTGILAAGGRRFRDALAPSATREALDRCVQAGITALVAVATADSEEEREWLGDVLGRFFADEEVGRELASILRGNTPDMAELAAALHEAGLDAETLPGLDLAACFGAFEGAFLVTATEETELQGVIEANQLLEQTRLQRELVSQMRELVQAWRAAKPETVGVKAGTLLAENVVNGTQVIYNVRVVPPRNAPRECEAHYLRTLIGQCDPLDLVAIDETLPERPGGGVDGGVRITQVFTSLDLLNLQRREDESPGDALARLARGESTDGIHTSPAEAVPGKEEKPLVPVQAVEALAALSRTVVLGEPGGGKSALVNHVAAQLARRRLGEAQDEERMGGWPMEDTPLPVRIVLRQFAAWLPDDQREGTAGQVWDYLEHVLSKLGCKDAFPLVREELIDRGGVVFFDGLDEVRQTDVDAKRVVITEAIAAFAAPLEKCRVTVTCREYAYKRDSAWRLPDECFRVVELALFSLDHVRGFTHTWYRATGPRKGWDDTKIEGEADGLFEAVKAWDHLRELSRSPLLLTLMAQVHGRDGFLPHDRADLYRRAVDLLLAHWENRIVRDGKGNRRVEPSLVMRLGVRTEVLRSALARVAFEAHERQETRSDRGERAADVPREDLREVLRADLGSGDRADEVIEYIQDRAGLLHARDNRTYTFPHRTFQEYLTAVHIMGRGEFDTMLAQRVTRDLPWWREVFLLAAGMSRAVPRNVSNLVDALIGRRPRGTRVVPEKVQHARLAAEALAETGFARHVRAEEEQSGESGRYAETLEKVRDWLGTAMVARGSLTAVDRAAAGNSLALVGDSRESVATLDGMEFCLVPAGPFWMGQDEDGDFAQHLNECLAHDYWLARYPVTVAQWKKYVKASGNKPGDSDGMRGTPSHPVIRVSWHEARQFCQWLTDDWKQKGVLPDGWGVRLPSEAEWEKAARGGLRIPRKPVIRLAGRLAETAELIENPLEKRRYPWDDTPNADLANCRETGIGTASPVGCFTGGASPYGCEEMAGNVWEWTRSLWGKDWSKREHEYPYDPTDGRENESASSRIWRLLCGGAYYRDRVSVGCSARFGGDPVVRYDDVGFRILLSPFPLSSAASDL